MLRELPSHFTLDWVHGQIMELGRHIQDESNFRDYLIGRAVAMETEAMGYSDSKGYSLAIRWYSCKDMEAFLEGYRANRKSSHAPATA